MLLDTCAILWIGFDQGVAEDAAARLTEADRLLISPFSAWEIGMLCAKKRLVLSISAIEWFDRFRTSTGAELAPLTATILAESHDLPGPFHPDPADRIIVATARALGVPLVTRDHKILAYADQGHVEAIPC